MSNPSGLYSRIKTWGSADTILGSDLNAEFDNVLSNFNPEMLAGYSQNVSEMQTQTSPGSVGAESLATSLSGELARLRFQINAITGNTYWYTAPAATITQLNSLLGATTLGNRINSGKTSGTTGSATPNFLLASGGTNTVTLKATATPFVYEVSSSIYTVSADTTLTGLTLASSATASVNDLTLPQAGTASTRMLGENGSTITVNNMAAAIAALAGNVLGFKTTAGEYLLGRVQSSTQITNCMRGFFYDSTATLVSRGTISNSDTLTMMNTAWIFINTAGTLSAVYNRTPKAGGIAPTSPNVQDAWYDTSTNIWKYYTGSTWAALNATLVGIALTDTSGCIATRSFDFFANYADLNTAELFADQINSGTIVRSTLTGAQVSVYGTLITYASDYVRWDFSTDMDTGSQTASTMYYFYLDTNGRSWISKTAPNDRRQDLKGYYHSGAPWRCLGYGWCNSKTKLETVESFYRGDDAAPVNNITNAAGGSAILPFNIIQREQLIALTGGGYTIVVPPPAQLKGKRITYVRSDDNPSSVLTIQSWGTAVANYSGTATISSSVLTGLSATASLAAGQLITGPGIAPNALVTSVAAGVATMSANALYTTLTTGTFSFANASGYSGTVGQNAGYAAYGLGGRFSLSLITQGESVTIGSDGFSYYLLDRYIPTGWFPAGVSNVTATTTAPTKGTIVSDLCQYRRLGNCAEIVWKYQQSGAGSNGTGTYLLTLPTGLTIDTTIQPTSTSTTNYASECASACGFGQGGVSTTGYGLLFPWAYDSTHIAARYQNGVGSIVLWDTSTLNYANASLGFCIQVTLPILNWGV